MSSTPNESKTTLTRRSFLRTTTLATLGILGAEAAGRSASAQSAKPPNILFAIADDWSWPHASIHGAPEVSTPTFDRIARQGILFDNAFTAAPQCSPNRASTLTCRNIWQNEEAGTHGSIFPNKFPVFTDMLEDSGYFIGYTGKGWAPGDWKRGGWDRNPAGPAYDGEKLEPPATGIRNADYAGNFAKFLDARPKAKPFFFWLGLTEPHRVYEQGSGIRLGKDPAKVTVPEFLPDDPIVRSDLLDYFIEVEWFDRQVGEAIKHIEAMGELDNTMVVITSDNGMPFPRAKANLYEYGTHVPLAIMWPKRIEGGRVTGALLSFIDFGPTFLDAAGIKPDAGMTGVSFLPFLTNQDAPPPRQEVLTGRERHTHARYDNLGYPARAIRTDDFLYIRNFKPGRWPMGDPEEYHDIDGSPSKSLILEEREKYAGYFAMAVGKRPEEELFAIKTDPACLHNLAGKPEFAEAKASLRARLDALLTQQGDPRMLGQGDIFESYPRVSHMRPELGGFAERGKYNPKYQKP